MSEQKQLCGFPRKRWVCCLLPTAVIAAVVVVAVVLTRPPDDIATEEQMETTSTTTAGQLTVLKTAALSGTGVAGTVSLLQATDDDTYFLALNDFVVDSASCVELQVRLRGAGSSFDSSGDGVAVVALTAAAGTADFTEPLDSDFEADQYEEAALWCADTGAESQLSDTADLATTTILDGSSSTIVREATLSGSGSYTVEGLVQIIGSSSIIDDALVTNFTLRFQDIDVSSGPDVFLYLTTDANDPDDVDADGSIRVELDNSERGTFSFTGTFSQETVPGFVSPEEYVAAVVWCDQFSVFFGSGEFEDV